MTETTDGFILFLILYRQNISQTPPQVTDVNSRFCY